MLHLKGSVTRLYISGSPKAVLYRLPVHRVLCAVCALDGSSSKERLKHVRLPAFTPLGTCKQLSKRLYKFDEATLTSNHTSPRHTMDSTALKASTRQYPGVCPGMRFKAYM